MQYVSQLAHSWHRHLTTVGHVDERCHPDTTAECSSLLSSGFVRVVSHGEEYKHTKGKDQIVYFSVFSLVTGTQQGLNEFTELSHCSTHLSPSNNDLTPCHHVRQFSAAGRLLKGLLRDSELRQSP